MFNTKEGIKIASQTSFKLKSSALARDSWVLNQVGTD
jgi:hypothetical protein